MTQQLFCDNIIRGISSVKIFLSSLCQAIKRRPKSATTQKKKTHHPIRFDIEGGFLPYHFDQWKINGKSFSWWNFRYSHRQVLQELVFDQGNHSFLLKIQWFTWKTTEIGIPTLSLLHSIFMISNRTFIFSFFVFDSSDFPRFSLVFQTLFKWKTRKTFNLSAFHFPSFVFL